MRTHFISDGKAYRNHRFHNTALSRSDLRYLSKTTKFVDKIWVYFSQIETDFRLLNMPMNKLAH